MKRHFLIRPLVLTALLMACTTPEDYLYDEIQTLDFYIINQSGQVLYEMDNWGAYDEQQRFYSSAHVIEKDCGIALLAHMPYMNKWEEFIAKLEESCPDAYVEIYEYNDSTQEIGRLLKRWSLQDSISGHHFFNFDSHKYSGSSCFKFTLLPEDIVGGEE